MLANSVLIIVTIVTRVCYHDILPGNIAMNTPGNLNKTRIFPTPSQQPCPVLQVKTTHHNEHLDHILGEPEEVPYAYYKKTWDWSLWASRNHAWDWSQLSFRATHGTTCLNIGSQILWTPIGGRWG